MNQEYQVVKTVRTALGQVLGDLHEFQLTTRSSALISYQTEKQMVHQGLPMWVRDVGVSGDSYFFRALLKRWLAHPGLLSRG